VFLHLTTFPALLVAIGRGFLTDFDLMIAKKGPLSSFGVFYFQRVPEIPTAQSWCSTFENI
jgi:hypothetical protein